jgi:hypothetical protein
MASYVQQTALCCAMAELTQPSSQKLKKKEKERVIKEGKIKKWASIDQLHPRPFFFQNKNQKKQDGLWLLFSTGKKRSEPKPHSSRLSVECVCT